MACASTAQRGVAGIYESCEDVLTRWIGQSTEALYYELGPPNLHMMQQSDTQTEMVWDMTIDRIPGQADEYGLLPLTFANLSIALRRRARRYHSIGQTHRGVYSNAD